MPLKVTSKGTIWVPLVREARSWWVFAKTPVAAKAKAKAKSGAKVRFDPDAMDVDKLKTRGQEPSGKASGQESAMVSRHTMYRKVHEPPTGASRALEVTPFRFLRKRMVKHDVLVCQKPVNESIEACFSCACGSSSACERKTVDGNNPNSCVGMSACVGSDSLVGMSACVGSNRVVGMSAAACVGSDSLVGMSAAACVGSDNSVGVLECVNDQSFWVFEVAESIAPSAQRFSSAQERVRAFCMTHAQAAARAIARIRLLSMLFWLLVFSPFVGAGCNFVGAPPLASLADFAPRSHSLASADFATRSPSLASTDFATRSRLSYVGDQVDTGRSVAFSIS